MSKGIDPKELLGNKKLSLKNLPWAGIVACAPTADTGAHKYGAHNYRIKGQPLKLSTYIDGLLRHILALMDGEDLTRDTLVPHLSAIALGGLIPLDALIHGNLVDDRGDGAQGVISAMLEDHELGRDIGQGPPQASLGTKDLDFCITEDKDDLLKL
jgi:hypothetical protein